jgi:hypothetical protein
MLNKNTNKECKTTEANLGKTQASDKCLVCQHIASINIGAPYKKGGKTIQYVQCAKCKRVSAVTR